MGEAVSNFISVIIEHNTLLLALLAFALFAQWRVVRLRNRTKLNKAARALTARFYERADKLLADDALPDSLKDVLYDVLVAVTDERIGVAVYDVLTDSPGGNKGESHLHDALVSLRSKSPDLFDDFIDAIRDAFASIICSFSLDDDRVAINLVKTNHQSQLVRYVERVESRIESAAFRQAMDEIK